MGNIDNGQEKKTKDPNSVANQFENKGGTVKSGNNEKFTEETEQKRKYGSCLKIFYVVLGILAVILAVVMIIVTILTSIATRAYDADQSSRIAAMVLLAITAAAAICMVIYMEVATFNCHAKPMAGAAVVLLILAIVQALVGGISVKVQPADEAMLLKSLAESFKLANEDVPRHYKLWSMTQYDLNCCGLYGAEDYRVPNNPYYFPPDVPISCCATYDPDRSDLVQERDREICKNKKTYYNVGCKDLVLTVFNETATMVLTVTIILIIFEVALLFVGIIVYKKEKNRIKSNKVSQSPN